MTDKYLPGARVRFTIDNLGVMGRDEIVNTGDTGTVIGPAPDEPWLCVEPDAVPESVCPVTPHMIEPLGDEPVVRDPESWQVVADAGRRAK